MSDLRNFLEDVFGGQTPVVRTNYRTGKTEEVYYNYDDEHGQLVEVYRQPASNSNPFTYRAPSPSPYVPLAKQAFRVVAGDNIVSDFLETYESLENKKQQHYNRQRFVHPDLQQGNGRQILNNEPDLWDCDENAIAHNLYGDSGNMDCRGRVGTPREHQQMIVAPSGAIVTSNENVGTYDFVSPNDDMLGHFGVDVAPWVVWGNNQYDQTTKGERLKALRKGGFQRINKYTRDHIPSFW